MQYYLPFKTRPLALIKLMWSLYLNPFQETWWEEKKKMKAQNQTYAVDKEQKPPMA